MKIKVSLRQIDGLVKIKTTLFCFFLKKKLTWLKFVQFSAVQLTLNFGTQQIFPESFLVRFWYIWFLSGQVLDQLTKYTFILYLTGCSYAMQFVSFVTKNVQPGLFILLHRSRFLCISLVNVVEVDAFVAFVQPRAGTDTSFLPSETAREGGRAWLFLGGRYARTRQARLVSLTCLHINPLQVVSSKPNACTDKEIQHFSSLVMFEQNPKAEK